MSTNQYQVTNYDEVMAQEAARTASIMRPTLDRLSFKTSGISVDQQIIGDRILCYILSYVRINSWYKNKFNPNIIESPACFSIFDKENELNTAPDPKSTEPQADLCRNCPKNVFGSSRDGRKGKDCSNAWRIMVIPAGGPGEGYQRGQVAQTPSGPRETGPGGPWGLFDASSVDSSTIYLSKIPVTSGKFFEAYCRKVASGLLSPVGPMPLWGVATVIRVVPDPAKQFVLEFDYIGDAPKELIPNIYAKQQASLQDLYYGYDVTEASVDAQQQQQPAQQATRF